MGRTDAGVYSWRVTLRSDGPLSIDSSRVQKPFHRRRGGWLEPADPDGGEAVMLLEEGWAVGARAPALRLELVSIAVNSVTRACVCGS